MKSTSVIVLSLLVVFGACKNKSEFHIRIEFNGTKYDTLLVQELVTGRAMAKVPLHEYKKDYSFETNESTLASLSVIGTELTYLTIIRPGVKKIVVINSTTLKTEKSIPDSLANYLWKSTNQMFSLYSKAIFAEDKPERVRSLFDSLMQARSALINKYKAQLNDDEFGILSYQNNARAYSFLMYYGRIMKRYSPESDFFQFIHNIDGENIYSKSLPENTLYAYEVKFLRERDSIGSIDAFLYFIETQTINTDIEDFLKAIYLKSVIESPSYWRLHEKLFITNTIQEAFQREAKNKYFYIVEKASNSFHASQSGVKGYDFSASKLDGSELKLSHFKNKVVLIDTWATWCGPCIEQRPKMIELAKKYKDNQDVVFLMISVDNSVDRWKKFVMQTNENQFGIELHIQDGMNGDFADQYLIKAIPKYILLDENGIIIDSNLPEPSIEMEKIIEKQLKKTVSNKVF